MKLSQVKCMKRLLTSNATVVFNGKITAKIFSDLVLFASIADADKKVCRGFHSLLDKYLEHMLVKFEQNRTAQNMQKFKLCYKS